MTTKIWDVVEFVKKHRSKLVAGASVLGGVYVLKKVVESDAMASLAHSAANGFIKNEENNASITFAGIESSNMNQARKNFLFDAHQQSCDKVLQQVIAEIQQTIQQRFDAESVVQKLKQNEGMNAKQKIHLWEELKIKAFGRILAVAYCYPLLVIAFKVQKSILCQESCRNIELKTKQQNESTISGMYSYASSFFWNKQENINHNQSTSTDPQTQQLFSNCINFLATEGIKELCNRVERVTSEVISTASLATEIDSQLLFQKAMSKMDQMTGNQNFSEFVVPCSGPVVSSLAHNSSHLQSLLKQFLQSLQSIMCKTLLTSFVKLYVDEALSVLNTSENKNLPLAKLIPIASETFGLISGCKTDTPFRQILISSELYQFSHLVFDVSSASGQEAINFV
uniref:Peroxisomal biogenesis factor 3 n=1 Tax=Ditylenchus dipsaci TaxID=166011 RepID=A0A915DAI9_9BILA